MSEEVGIAQEKAKRVVFADVTGDGYADLILDATRLLVSRADPDTGRRFEARSGHGLDRGRNGMLRRPDLALFADVDNDGDLDAISAILLEPERPMTVRETGEPVLVEGCPIPHRPDRGERTAVLLNDGTGRFRARNLSGLERPESTAAIAAFDSDRDGLLDLFVGNWYREYGQSLRSYSDRLYRGGGDGSFEDVSREAGVVTADSVGERTSAKPTYGVTVADVDDDGRSDILVATYGRQWNVLWRQQADGTYEDVAAAWSFDGDERRSGEYFATERETELEFRSNGNTFEVAVSDFDNDGDLDLLTGEIRHYWGGTSSDQSELLVNDENQRFERVRDRGLDRVHRNPWRWNEGDIHVAFFDFDNDGLDDALIASGDYRDPQLLRLWRQLPDHRFREVTNEVGLDWEGCGAISIADYDRDGDLDIAVGRSLARLTRERRLELGSAPAIWRNDGGNRKHWFQIRLVGTEANRWGVGARVRLRGGGRTLTKVLRAGNGHMGHQDEMILHFGLGDDEQVASVEVRWPDADLTIDRFGPFAADQRVTLEQRGGAGR